MNARWLIPVPVLAALAVSAVAVVPPEQQGVIVPLAGEPEAAGSGPVLHWPLAERVVRVERRLTPFATGPIELRSADGQVASVELTGQYRVTDPAGMVRRLGGPDAIAPELARLAAPLAQALLAPLPLPGLTAPDSARPLARALDTAARASGVAVIDLRVRHATLAPAARQAVLARMQGEREAATLSLGDSGMRQAMQIRSDAEVAAAAIIGASAGRDPEFYDFYRAMNSYETMFADPARRGKATLILPADSPYLRQMNLKPAGK